MNAPRVLSIVWNLIRGGTEGQCARMAMAMARRGHVHRVAVFRREGLFLEPVESICGPVYTMGIHRLLEFRTAESILRLRGYIRDERFDLVHTWDADAAVFGSIAARLARVPWITSRRDMGEIYPPWKLRLMRWADRGARSVVVNAEAIATSAACRHVAREHIACIPNVLDLREFDVRAQEDPGMTLPRTPGPWIVHVARLDPEKDLGTFLRAAAIVAASHPSAMFIVAGDGRERSALEALARELGVQSRMLFLGDVVRVPALLARCAVGVLLPSRNEGLSNTILEYMAAGLPVVATDCGGNSELVEEGVTGYVTPVGDAAVAAARVLHLLEHEADAKTMGRAGRAKAERQFSVDIVADAFESLYARARSR